MSDDALLLDEILRPIAGEKPQLHVSGMGRLLGCGVSWEYRNVHGIREVPTFRLHEGTAVHKAAEMALRRKALGAKAELEEMIQFAREALDDAISTGGVRLQDDEIEAGLAVRKGKAVEYVVDLVKLVHDEVVPSLNPLDENHVEWRWVIELPDEDYDLAGTADCVEKDGTVQDLKTKTSSPPSTQADTSEQLTWYAMARLVHTGALPPKLALQFLIRTPARHEVKRKVQETVRTMDDVAVEHARIKQAMRSIKTGVFLPAATDSWRCSKRYCGFFGQCPYSMKRVTGGYGD